MNNLTKPLTIIVIVLLVVSSASATNYTLAYCDWVSEELAGFDISVLLVGIQMHSGKYKFIFDQT